MSCRAQALGSREDKSLQCCTSLLVLRWVTSWTNCTIHGRLAVTSCSFLSLLSPTTALPAWKGQICWRQQLQRKKKTKLQSKQREATKSPLLGGGGSSSVSKSSVLIANQSVDRSGKSSLTPARRAIRNSFLLKRLIKAQFYQQSAHQKRPIKRGINMNIMSAAALSLNWALYAIGTPLDRPFKCIKVQSGLCECACKNVCVCVRAHAAVAA